MFVGQNGHITEKGKKVGRGSQELNTRSRTLAADITSHITQKVILRQ
jgi:hypothetical protein